MKLRHKIGLGLVTAAVFTLFVGCADIEDNSELTENTDHRDYHYLDEVKIEHGFYKDFSCVVLREYRRTVFCRVIKFLPNQVVLNDQYQPHINVSKTEITKLPDDSN